MMMVSSPRDLIHRVGRPGLVSPLGEPPCGTPMRSGRGSCGWGRREVVVGAEAGKIGGSERGAAQARLGTPIMGHREVKTAPRLGQSGRSSLRPIRYVGLRRLGAAAPISGPDCPVSFARLPDMVSQSLDRQAVDLLDEFPNHRSESFHQGPGLFELAASGKVFEV